MKLLRSLFIGSLFVCGTGGVLAQQTPVERGLGAITKNYAMPQLKMLSSNFMEGRKTGEFGEKMAAAYIASIYQMIGLKPAGDINPDGTRSYYQKLPYTKRTLGDDQSLSIISLQAGGNRHNIYNKDVDYFVSTAQVSQKLNVGVVFAGYGMIDSKNGYNDFEGLDVKGKVVVVLEGFPGHKDSNSELHKKFHLEGRFRVDPRVAEGKKYMIDNGAVAVMTITSSDKYLNRIDKPSYPSERISSAYPYSTSLNTGKSNTSLIDITVSPRIANDILGDVVSIEQQITASGKPASKQIPNRLFEFEMEVELEAAVGYNVLGMIEGESTDLSVVVAGHYDHMGINQRGFVWNGADDNASGTVGVMTIAKAFMESGEKPRCNVIFGAWTGEEIGMNGSRYFVQNFKDGKLKANMNFDMVGREISDGSTDVLLQLPETHMLFLDMAKQNVERYNIGVNITTKTWKLDGSGSTDYVSFSREGVPFMSWKGGHRDDYHNYTDHVENIDHDIFIKLIKMGFLSAWDLANKPIELVK